MHSVTVNNIYGDEKDTTPSACSKAVDDNCLTDSSCLERDFPLNKRCLLYLNTL